ncbi:MAG TPA: hypothetical protein VMZ92_20115, partial [Planctomycetota bacterium]|nr:hypothetical protein [Planctomycetota bacterium]
MKTVKALLAGAALLIVTASWASAQEPAPPRISQETMREFNLLAREVQQLFADKKHEAVLPKCRRMIELIPSQPNPHYNLACALALLGKTEEALESLAAAVEKGFNDPAHIKADDDLASLRQDKRFTELVEKARENEKKASPYEPGLDLPGVRTVEDFPEGGLRFRLRMSPEATVEKPNRLIVWLHPAGGSMNNLVEPLSVRFLRKNFALVCFTQKNFRYWTGADIDRLMKHTLPAVRKIEGIDAEKPVLMGYSAGGQAALQLWQKDAGRFGGLVLDAAYPVMRSGPTQYAPLPLPEGEAVKQVPMFVLVGEDDGGARFWAQIEPVWRKAGVPLTIDYVPGRGHTWLFGNFQLAALDAWLADVAAGKVPRPPEPGP